MKPRIRPLTELERSIYGWRWCVTFGDGRAWFGNTWREAWMLFNEWLQAPIAKLVDLRRTK